jgi:hypothetical protein
LGDYLLFSVFLKITGLAHITYTMGYFFHGTSDVLILTLRGLGQILGDFLQTHLVTLLSTSHD